MIRFQCPSCAGIIKTNDENAGRRGRCAHCGKPVTMPAAGTDTASRPTATSAAAPQPARVPAPPVRKPEPKPARPKADPVMAKPPVVPAAPRPKPARKPEPAAASSVATPPIEKADSRPPINSAPVPTAAAASPKSRRPAIIGGSIAAVVAIVAVIFAITGGNDATPQGDASPLDPAHGASSSTGEKSTAVTTITTAPFEVTLMKPVNVGAAVNRNKEIAIPADVKLSLPTGKHSTPQQYALIAQQLEQLLAATANDGMKPSVQIQTATAWALARERDKALASLSADAHPLVQTLVFTELGRGHLLAGDRAAAKVAADEALAMCTQPPTPAAAAQRHNRAFIMRKLADLFGQLNDEKSQAAASLLASEGGRPERPVDVAVSALMARLSAGDLPAALKAAESLPPEIARGFYYWLGRQHEERDEKPAAAALYLRSLRLEKPGANPADDGRLVFDSITHECISGLLRCGASTPAIEQILALPPSQPRRQAYLEMAVGYLGEQGDHATAIAAAVNGGHLMLAAEAQIKAGLNVDAAASLRKVVSALPPSPSAQASRNHGGNAHVARQNLIFELANLQIRAGDVQSATQTLEKITAKFSPVPAPDAPLESIAQFDGGYYDPNGRWRHARQQAARLYAAAGRLDKAVALLDSIVAMNQWLANREAKQGAKPDPRKYYPSQNPHPAMPLIEAEYAGHLFRVGKKAESAAQFDKAIAAELAAMAAAPLPQSPNPQRPELRKPVSLILQIAKARLDAGDIEGLVAMYAREEIAAVHPDDGGNRSSDLGDAAHAVAIALAKADRLPAALRISKGAARTRMEIAAYCHEKQDHAGVLLAMAEPNMAIIQGPWTASPQSYSQVGVATSDREASTPQLRALAAAGAKAKLNEIQDYLEKTDGFGLRVIAKARADAGDKAGARLLLEQGLEQAAVQRRVSRQVQLIDTLRAIGEAPLADAAQAVIEESENVLSLLEPDVAGDFGQAVVAEPVTIDHLTRLVKAAQNADPKFKERIVIAAISTASALVWPEPVDAYNPNAFTGTVMNAQMLDAIETRWVNMERPPTLLGTAPGESADRIEVLARELRLYRRANDYAIPPSLEALAAARKIDLAKLTGGDPANIEVIQSLPLDSGPKVVFMIDKKKRPGGINAIITVPGLVELITDDELQKRLKNPPVVTYDSFDKRTYPPTTRWAAYGEPPVVVDRQVFKALEKTTNQNDKMRDVADGDMTHLLNHRLHNLGATLRAYAQANEGNYPASYQALRDSGFLIHEEDLEHPMGETFGYTIIAGRAPDYFGKPPIAIDNAPVFYELGDYGDGRKRYLGNTRFVSVRGQVETTRIIEHLYPCSPPLRTFKIEANDPIHIKARKQMINLRTVLQKYADKNGGRFPVDLLVLVKEGYLPDDSALRSPVHPTVGYTYVAGLTTQSPPNLPLLLDPLSSGYPVRDALLVGHVGLDVMYYPQAPPSIDPSYFRDGQSLKPLRFGEGGPQLDSQRDQKK